MLEIADLAAWVNACSVSGKVESAAGMLKQLWLRLLASMMIFAVLITLAYLLGFL